MSPEAWIVLLSVALVIAVIAAVIFLVDMIRADEARDKAADERDRLAASAKVDAISIEALTAERDAALAAKSAHFEESQRQIADLKAERDEAKAGPFKGVGCAAIIPTESDPEELFVYVQAHDNFAAEARARRVMQRLDAGLRAEKLEAELALLRPIADAAEKLLDDEKLPGEWAPVRAAIRARKEADNG